MMLRFLVLAFVLLAMPHSPPCCFCQCKNDGHERGYKECHSYCELPKDRRGHERPFNDDEAARCAKLCDKSSVQ